MFNMNKRGNILTENFVFVILNVVFLSILLIFVFTKLDSAAELEERTAKTIALILNEVRTDAEIYFDAENLIKNKEKEYNGDLIRVDENLVTVQLRSKGGYSYSFFNNGISVENIYLSQITGKENSFVFIIKEVDKKIEIVEEVKEDE